MSPWQRERHLVRQQQLPDPLAVEQLIVSWAPYRLGVEELVRQPVEATCFDEATRCDVIFLLVPTQLLHACCSSSCVDERMCYL